MEENRALDLPRLKYWRKPKGLARPSRTWGLLEPVVLGQFKVDVRANRAFNVRGHDWVKLISGATAGIERGLGSGSLRRCESRDARGLSPTGSPGRMAGCGPACWAADQAVMVCADRSLPGRAAPPRCSWAGSRLTRGEREQPRLQPVGPLGRLMDVLGCERLPPRPVQPIHNELQFPGLPARHRLPLFLPAAACCLACKALSSHSGARWGGLPSPRCRALPRPWVREQH